MKRVRTENANTQELWDGVYATEESARRWTQWGAADLVAIAARNIPLHCHVLDVATGAGIGPEQIAAVRKDIRWTGTDFSSAAIQYLRSNGSKIPWYDSVQADITVGLPFPDGAFEVVMCTELLEHLEFPQRAVKELVRVSRSRVIITTPRENVVDAVYHIWSISEKDLRQMLEPYGSVETCLARSNRQIVGVLCKS